MQLAILIALIVCAAAAAWQAFKYGGDWGYYNDGAFVGPVWTPIARAGHIAGTIGSNVADYLRTLLP